jgi:micrococcal nuclease
MERRRTSDRTDTSRAWLVVLGLAAVIALASVTYTAIRAIADARPDSTAPAREPGAAPAGPVATTAGPATGPETAPADLTRATVARVVDGDTVRVLLPDGTEEPVRLIGVDTPESTTRHEPYGAEASAFAKRQLPKGRVVWLEFDVRLRDKYGRLLAYVWLEPPTARSTAEVRDRMFNARLLLEGYASLMTIPPTVRYVDAFTPMQAEARDASRGLWGLPSP